jgi:pimeloyl-ACP methyl ester carboxylesterase
VLLTHGADDAIVKPAVVDRHKALVSHAQIDIMPNTGHAPFWDQVTTFNRRLGDFAASVVT